MFFVLHKSLVVRELDYGVFTSVHNAYDTHIEEEEEDDDVVVVCACVCFATRT